MNLFLYGIMPLVMVYCFLTAPSRSAVAWSVAVGFLVYFPLVVIQFALRFSGFNTNNIMFPSVFWFYLITDYAVPVGFFLLIAFAIKWQKLLAWETFAPVAAFFAAAFAPSLVVMSLFGNKYDGMYEFIYRPLTLVGLVVTMSFVINRPLNLLGWLATGALMALGALMAAFVFTINPAKAIMMAGIALVWVALFWGITRFVVKPKGSSS